VITTTTTAASDTKSKLAKFNKGLDIIKEEEEKDKDLDLDSDRSVAKQEDKKKED
jgi:hypothetical protein